MGFAYLLMLVLVLEVASDEVVEAEKGVKVANG